ncbi:cation diffusion facilitator family transporter [Anaerobaca lacustris]|uniref:Cation diffusion facilitator family transporter n=1 Tax=Anaerobaca lacustris TaxID=3044600 RepID=A0AAW6U5H4_9BACT|nr:cation diffusion facilitator family transporter [Sedimentisphaerales bacterium M17dextr]
MNVAHAHRPKETGPFEEIHEYRGVEKRKLKLAMAITGTTMVVEIVGGILTNSLALLSDAGHMFTHLFALTVSFAAIVFASREPCHHRTFGLYRVEILAALFNSLFLFAVTGIILYAGIERLFNPRPVLGLQMLAVAVVGLLVNLASVLILHGSSHDDLNVKGAFLHVLADTVSSVAIIIGAVALYATGWDFIDPLLAIGISVLIFVWAYGLFREAVEILLESTPKGLSIEDVSRELKAAVPEIREIRDMHIWVITSNMYSLTAHIVANPVDAAGCNGLVSRVNAVLAEKYEIEHTTIQMDAA